MRAIFAIIISAIALLGCNQDSDVTGSVETCARQQAVRRGLHLLRTWCHDHLLDILHAQGRALKPDGRAAHFAR